MHIDEQLSSGTSPSSLDAEAYLGHLRMLAGELERAMGAIVTRQLTVFEDSVCRQKVVSARLAASPRQVLAAQMDVDLAARIQVSVTHLNVLNQRYSALLKHSGDTMRIFAGLFRSYSGPGQQAASNHRTWSSEL